MKMRRWLSRAVVLAMVVAMMVPMPVMAKSSDKGGKLVKTVTYYSYNEKTNTYRPESKTSYTYDKKNNPSEIKTVDYGDWFLNIPTKGVTRVTTQKYKYKGKNAKSMVAKNDAGFVVSSRKYKKGRVVSFASQSVSTMGYITDEKTGEPYYVNTGKETSTKSSGSVAYDKAGTVKAGCYVMSGLYEGKSEGTFETNEQYYVVQKKGIPSYIYTSYRNWKRTDENGKVTSGVDTDGGEYITCNSKGLVTQTGWYSTKYNKYTADNNVQYVMKKGNVAEAVVTYIDIEGKEKVSGKYVFTYTKTKTSKQRYMNMINDIIDVTYGGDRKSVV